MSLNVIEFENIVLSDDEKVLKWMETVVGRDSFLSMNSSLKAALAGWMQQLQKLAQILCS